jgi:hypothetical protein
MSRLVVSIEDILDLGLDCFHFMDERFEYEFMCFIFRKCVV